ncbi:glycosyltransferase family 39 protein [Ramlibacter sp. USB13]|uniref:Glycosyltransferase family 39 protein n=1 Tax=Ramlibacter cellulosilyticus TaxID=2764187 RepID=A0A923MLS9_9BURK|nr:glycosyltransferase family 39 protein [Ramlibacter cellulosilyticus]MBC5781730.1 glycosyltransferase family 39 protein [Ramlibacter cellulosilyticus]
MTAPPQDKSVERLGDHARFLFLVAVAVIVFVNCINVGNPILERHAFRQTQTALTAQMFLEHGFRLSYETPVLGEPWSMPLEFPLYQALVALVTYVTGASITVVGRLVSLAFTLACCLPIHATLRRLGVPRHAKYLALAMFLTSPVYLFWAGTFMIESTALFFALCFLYFAVRISEGSPAWRDFAGCAVFLALALLQKVTTVLPMLAVAGVLVLARNWRAGRSPAFWAAAIASVAVPLAIGWGWIAWTDAIKAKHPLAVTLTSQALADWNYGPLHQRWSGHFWQTLGKRMLWPSLAMLLAFVAVGIAWFRADRRLLRLHLALLALFLLPLLVFANVHFVHDYYQSANAVFWSVLVGLSVAAVMERARPVRYPWRPLLAGALLLANVDGFNEQYDIYKFRRIGDEHRTLQLAEFVRRETPPELPVVWIGDDWSSEYAFYSRRRSLTVPKWYDLEADMLHGRRYLSTAPSAVVSCLTRRSWARNYPKLIEQETGAKPVRVADCDVYVLQRAAAAPRQAARGG